MTIILIIQRHGEIMNYTPEQLYGMGLIRDRRRRILKPIKGSEHAYHILEKEMKRYTFLSSKLMYLSLFYVVSLGLLKQSIFISFVLALIVFIGIQIFSTLFYSKDRAQIKLHVDDIKLVNSKEFLKLQASNLMSDAFIVSMVLILTAYQAFFAGMAQNPIEATVSYIVLALSIYKIVLTLLQWFNLKRTIKSL